MIRIDTSEITAMVNADEIGHEIEEDAEAFIVNVFNEVTAPPPDGTPVDTGFARNGWQIDLSDKRSPELYSMVPYINRLNDGWSKQSPAAFIDRAVDKFTD